MDTATIYEMAAAMSRSAERACQPPPTEPHWQGYGGYPAYVREYNRLAKLTVQLVGAEASELFPLFDDSLSWMNPADVPPIMWRTYLEQATARLTALASYLKSKMNVRDQEYGGLLDLIGLNLRPAIFADPDNERQVQDVLETIFRTRGLAFRREQSSIAYSTKRYIPDFTFDAMAVALEVKLCARSSRQKELIDEINADIVGYGSTYQRIIFVIYDLGFIRDQAAFVADIEKNSGVHVLIVKK